MTTYVKSLTVAVIIGFVGILIASKIASSSPPPPPLKKVEPVFLVRAHTIETEIQRPLLFLIGEVEARDYAQLTAPVEAEILGISTREGELFKKGHRLVNFDLREQKLSERAQEANLENTRLQLKALQRNRETDAKRLEEVKKLLALAKSDYERNQELVQKGVITRTQMENAEQALSQRQLEFLALNNQVANYAIDIARVEQTQASAQAQLAQTQLLIDRGEIRAPFAGRVAQVLAAVGSRPARGAPLLEIFDPSRLRLRVALPQRYRAVLLDGVGDALLEENGKTTTLALDRFEPQVTPGNSAIDVFFNLPNDNWVLGAVHNVALRLPATEDLLAVPPDAIYQDSLIYQIGEDSRVQAISCEYAGIGRDGDTTTTLLKCPDFPDEARIVANQLPNLIGGTLVSVVAQP